jgi:lysozyme
MKPRLSVSKSAIELIKAFEGYRAKSARLDDGRWTIGYGHTLTAREGAEVNEADAEALLLYDLIQASHAVNEHVFAPLNQNQFDALVSFVFNIGERAFRGSPTLRRLNEGRPLEAALSMELWRKADLDGDRIVVDALVRRRAAEKALFLKPIEGWLPAPSPVLPPKMDYDALGLMPWTSPVTTQTATDGERVWAERAPETTLEPEAPSATAAAAAAVIQRLEALLGEEPTAEPAPQGPEPAEPAALRTPEPPKSSARPAAAEPASTGFGFTPIAIQQLKGRRNGWLTTFGPPMLMLSAGVGLLALAAVWLFQPESQTVFGASPKLVGWFPGILGILSAGLAVYFILERLGLPRDRRTG